MIAHWPALLIGLMIAAYWARVLKLVRKMRKHAGADANLVPPEPLGRLLRLVWYPTVGVWILHPLYNGFAFAPPSLLRPPYRNAIVEWAALLVAAAAFAATLICWKRMGKSWRMGINPNERTQLVL